MKFLSGESGLAWEGIGSDALGVAVKAPRQEAIKRPIWYQSSINAYTQSPASLSVIILKTNGLRWLEGYLLIRRWEQPLFAPTSSSKQSFKLTWRFRFETTLSFSMCITGDLQLMSIEPSNMPILLTQ
ncbi:MAG: hypothetical protein HEQ39_02440 [Rhizobacter sp.]